MDGSGGAHGGFDKHLEEKDQQAPPAAPLQLFFLLGSLSNNKPTLTVTGAVKIELIQKKHQEMVLEISVYSHSTDQMKNKVAPTLP
ncbi:hypothetical protein scyTo_0000314 [Scyliorhinus torazame]|uniref:Uncharacterized protein n=1 Tax=Scyliorhinus torazame TaxID=75743 RepID=A0A401NUX6_SCYTO|nr:hypothetical protein [Scyliorhinus torazame]